MTDQFKITLDILPPSINEYLAPGIRYIGGKPTPYTYETTRSKEFKRYFRMCLQREMEKQNWDRSVTSEGHWYLECIFVQSRTNQDCNNYFKILLDAMTGYIITDDKNILPRVHKVTYDSKNPSFSIVLRKVEYEGLFSSAKIKDEFISKCSDCRYFKNGGCAILKKISEGRENEFYDSKNNTCKKYITKKGK